MKAGRLLEGTEAILFVDDDDILRALIKRMLTQLGYTVLTASDGEEALEIYSQQQESINLVILDLNMPGMGGKKCLEALLHLNPQVRVIVASGSIEEPLFHEFKAIDIRILNKPFRLEKLLRTIRDALL